ncbi:MAG TPA: hypothetical protein PLA71_00775 [Saccharofermentans sp.]|nr:hypothetical protein [Saccharofermentans sp.]
MSNKFDATLLDQLIDNTLFQEGEIIEEEPKVTVEPPRPEKNALDGLNTLEGVYTQMAELAKTGNELLETAKYSLESQPDNAEAIAGVASLLNSVKDTLKEFSKVYLMKVRFDQQKELENLKTENKKKLLEHKISVDSESGSNTTKDLIPYSQEQLIKLLNG